MKRRSFLKLSGLAVAGSSIGLNSNPFSLKEVTAAESEEIVKRLADVTVKYTADCMCPSECGMEMWIKGGKVWKIYGNPHAPLNYGGCCAKGAAGTQLIYSPDRNKRPMIRVGERGEGKFREATWDEAIDYIAQRLVKYKKEFGPESLIMNAGDITDRDQYHRLGFAYGTPNCVEHGSICDTPRRHGPKLMLGGKRVEPDLMRPILIRDKDGKLKEDLSHKAKLIIYVGWNPFVATRIVYEGRGTVAAQVENGCKVWVVDPAHTNTASKADKWLPIRPGTDGDLFAALLRYILENDDQSNPSKKYIWPDFKKYSIGWDEFESQFKSWWQKKDPINDLNYFTLEWAADRCGIPKADIEEMAHTYGITKPAALVWGMQSPGHHYNGYPCSILGTALNIITGNFDVPGGVIDTELVKASKGGNASGKQFAKIKTKRIVNGVEVEDERDKLHMDWYGDWPAGWDDVVGDYPRRFLEGVTINYGPFKGYKYPIKAFFIRTGNPVITGSATYTWTKALTEKDSKGEYKVPLVVNIDTLYLETGMYSDVILPEASYAERMSLSDIYPSHPLIYLRDQVIQPMHECKTPTEIMNMLAKRLYELGDRDIDPKEFWEKYATQEDFVNEMLEVTPGRHNVGRPLPYPIYPEGYKIIGTPDSLEEGRVKIDHDKKEIIGEKVTCEWLRNNKGVAVWPMSYQRYRKIDPLTNEETPNGVWPYTDSKKIEFQFNRYEKYNKLIEESGIIPPGLKEIGFNSYPKSFYWFETVWNPYTNVNYKKYKDEYPFQLIVGRVHHAMSGTQMIPALAETPAEGLFMPLNKEFESDMIDTDGKGGLETKKRKIKEGTFCVGTVQVNREDAIKLDLKTGDLVEIENPLQKSTKSRIFVTDTIRPGVIRMGFGTGGRFSPGLGPTYKQRDYTPNHNELVDPKALSPIMGQPAYADMVVKIKKL